MVKKTSGSDPVTKDYLDQALDRGFSKFRGVLTEEFDAKLNFRLGVQKDEIMHEVKDIITENNSVLFARIDRELGTEQLRRLEKRVKKLETS